jgi:hypothetical protein
MIINDATKMNWICPDCHSKFYDDKGLFVDFEDLKHGYCLRCYAEWIDKNIPKLVKITNDD